MDAVRGITQQVASSAAISRLAAIIIFPTLIAVSMGCAGIPNDQSVTIPPSRIEYLTKTFSTPVGLPPLITPPIAHPDFPGYAMRHPRPGMVVLKIDVDVQGRVTAVEVLDSTNILLESSARQAALQWSFEPARRNGHAVSATIVVPVEFTQGEP